MLNRGDLPAGYKKLEYLESTGTQFIDTQQNAFGLSWELKFQVQPSGLVSEVLNGVFDIVNAIQVGCTKDPGGRPFLNVRAYGAEGADYIDEGARGAPIYAGVNLTEASAFIGDKKRALGNNRPNIQANFLLFARFDLRIGGVGFSAPEKIFYFNYSAENGKGKLLPALDPTGTPCMFDLVTKTPFYNNGTGDFLYPGKEEQATTYSLRRPRMYAQMTEHGIRRLYHVPKGYNGTQEEYAAEHGFKILVETPAPEEGYWLPVWHEREDCIELEWVETEPPVNEEENI